MTTPDLAALRERYGGRPIKASDSPEFCRSGDSVQLRDPEVIALADAYEESEAAAARMREAIGTELLWFWKAAESALERGIFLEVTNAAAIHQAALSPTAGRELLAELTAYRAWVPRAVEAMKVAHEGFRSALACGAQTYQEQREADFAKDALSAALASAPKQKDIP